MDSKAILPVHGNQKKAWMVLGAACFFYFFELFIRAAPGTMLREMLSEYRVTSVQLGVASGIYYYIYAPMQIFSGILLDRFGGRRVMLPASMIVAIGCGCILIPWNSIWLFAIGRFLMGFGSAFGFIGVMYLATVWFHEKRLSLISGLATALGFLGSILALKWIPYIVDAFNWKGCWLIASILGIISIVILWVCIPHTSIWEKKRQEAHLNKFTTNHVFSGFFSAIKNKQIWLLGIIGGILYMPATVLGDLWGKQYIETVHNLSSKDAGLVISKIYLGWLLGAPLWGFIAEKTGLKRSLLFLSTSAVSILLLIFIFYNNISVLGIKFCLFLIGFFSGPQVICFSMGAEMSLGNAKASAMAAVNMIVTLVGGILQPVVGFILDCLCKGHLDGIISYNAYAFKWALLTMPIIIITGFLLTFGLRSENSEDV